MKYILEAVFFLTAGAAVSLFIRQRRRSSLEVITESSLLSKAAAAMAVVSGAIWLAFGLAGGQEHKRTVKPKPAVKKNTHGTEESVTTVPRTTVQKPNPAPKPRKVIRHKSKTKPVKRKTLPRRKTQPPKKSQVITKTVTVYETTAAPAPKIVPAVKRPPITTVPKPKPRPKPKQPARPKVIAPFVWVIARVVTPDGADLSADVRLREYRGHNVIKLAVLKSGTAVKYYYRYKGDQLCQVIRPGSTPISSVCVQINGGPQVIPFTSQQTR